jgi:hypothetical protein
MLIVSITLTITALTDCRSAKLDVSCSFINMGQLLHPSERNQISTTSAQRDTVTARWAGLGSWGAP